jgi:hypothetical protein
MSTISSGTTLTTALVQTGDTTGDLVIKTGSSNTTAMTISGTDQSVVINGSLTANVNVTTLTGVVKITNGGTNATSASAARTNLGLAIGTDVLAPNGSAASLTSFPTLNQNTTGSAGSVSSGSWTITISGTKILFAYGGVNKGSLDSSGNFIVTGNVTAYGTP